MQGIDQRKQSPFTAKIGVRQHKREHHRGDEHQSNGR
ncbi:Uncharacterised protein [Vibrio cholerae]|nr:Uncharacterised protein [Vibrio cholerae]